MTLDDTVLVMEFLRLGRLGLSPEQLREIERVIDRRPREVEAPWVSYKDAAAALGMKTRQGVHNWIKAGRLVAYVPAGGERALGVTRQSLAAALGRSEA